MSGWSRMMTAATAWLVSAGLFVVPASEALARKSGGDKPSYGGDKSSGSGRKDGEKSSSSGKSSSERNKNNGSSRSSSNSRDRSERSERRTKESKSRNEDKPRVEKKPTKTADDYKPRSKRDRDESNSRRQPSDSGKVARHDPPHRWPGKPDGKKDPKKDPKPRYSQVPPKGSKPDPKGFQQYPNRPMPDRTQPRPSIPVPQIALPPVPVIPVPDRVTPLPQTAFVPPQISPRQPEPPQGKLPPRKRELPPRRIPSVVPPPNDVARKRDREILIAMDDGVSDGDTLALGNGLNLNVEVQYRSALLGVKLVRLRIPDGRSLTQAIQQIVQANDPRIIAVQPNYVFETAQVVASNAPIAAPVTLPQYAPEKIRLSGAHRVALGRDVRIAVIDTGLDSSHPELAGAIADTFDAIGEGEATAEAHGTAIAGIVASHRQITGTAPDARVLAVRSFATGKNRKTEASTLSVIKGLDWAAANNARVINMSFAGPKDALLHEAIEQAEARGLIMVAAAGNGGPKAASAYPAAYDRVIAVTATDSDDKIYAMANRGSYVAIAAPGVDILTPAPKAAYEMSSGTSLAAAHISGIIALMLERKPDLSTDEIKRILARTARAPGPVSKAGGPKEFGAGIVDATKAVQESQ